MGAVCTKRFCHNNATYIIVVPKKGNDPSRKRNKMFYSCGDHVHYWHDAKGKEPNIVIEPFEM